MDSSRLHMKSEYVIDNLSQAPTHENDLRVQVQVDYAMLVLQ